MSVIFPKESCRRVVVSKYSDDPVQAIEENCHLEDVAPPDVSTLKSTEVVVEIKAASVGWVDLLMTSGLYQHMALPPYCPGLEYSGVVAWVGADVENVVLGQKVMVDGFLAGPRTSGPYQRSGGFATYAVIPKEAAVPQPSSFTFSQGACFLGNYETAYHCLIACGALKEGEVVLIHGASGSTGLAAVHIANQVGATVIATGRSDEKLEYVQAQGADHVLNIKDFETGGIRKFRDDVKALTEGKGVDVVYDGVGGDISIESLRCVKFGARVLIVGWAATPFVSKGRVKGKQPDPNMLPTNLIMMKGLKVLGCPTVISTQQEPGIRVERLKSLLDWADSGILKPHVSHEFSLEEFRDGMRAKWEGKVIGGCVLHPA